MPTRTSPLGEEPKSSKSSNALVVQSILAATFRAVTSTSQTERSAHTHMLIVHSTFHSLGGSSTNRRLRQLGLETA
eukprot:4952256-Amphidinium_carterae.4